LIIDLFYRLRLCSAPTFRYNSGQSLSSIHWLNPLADGKWSDLTSNTIQRRLTAFVMLDQAIDVC
uniref:Pecanex-like protein n=1 Tax=Ascaris lumbricoides TaxID=6252 RepID=A0A0M3HP15_ASCLU